MREVGFASDARHSRSNSLPTVHVGAPPWSPDDRMLPRSLEASLLRRASVVSVQCHWFQRPCWTDGKPTRNSRKNPNLAWCRLAPPIDCSSVDMPADLSIAQPLTCSSVHPSGRLASAVSPRQFQFWAPRSAAATCLSPERSYASFHRNPKRVAPH